MAVAHRNIRRHETGPKRAQHRFGLTLVELLMVIAIMTILFAVAIPMVRPAFKDRKLREASRQINAFFAGAKARAAELDRPVGVWLERLDGTELGSRQAVRLYMAEVAPSFTGGTLGSTVSVVATGPTTGQLSFNSLLDDRLLRTMVAPGEQFTIKFDHRGYDYYCLRPLAPANAPFEIVLPLGMPPGLAPPNGQAFEILRGPVRSSVSPLTLPGEVAIDLSVSGVGTSGNELDTGAGPAWTSTPVIVMFAPTGRIDFVFVSNFSFRPFGPLHLLIGRRTKTVNPLTTDVSDVEKSNLADPANLWVTIGHRTGTVTTSDNADTSYLAGPVPGPAAPVGLRIKRARDFARSTQQKGGR